MVAQTSAKPADDGSSLATRTAGLQRHDGFFPYYWDEKKGDILFELSPAALQGEFLYFTGLGSGVGSIEAFADRSSFGGGLGVPLSAGWDARAGDSGEHQLPRSERQRRNCSIPWNTVSRLRCWPRFRSKQSAMARCWWMPTALLMRDAFDLLSQLRRPSRAVGGVVMREQSSKAADWRLDKDRSVIDLEHTGSFPLNTEVEALLTFCHRFRERFEPA